MRLLALMALLPPLIYMVAIVVMQVPLPSPFPQAGTMARTRLAIVVTVPCFVGYIAIVAAHVFRSFDQPGRTLDRSMTRFSLVGRPGGVFGRRYQGDLRGRQVRIDFQPARSPQSHLLTIYLSLSRSSKAAIGLSRPLLDCRNCPEMRLSEPGLADLRAYAEDEAWLRAVLRNGPAQAALASLMRGDEWSGHNELYFQPDRLWLRAHPRLAEGDGAEWLPALLVLAAAAESASTFQPRGSAAAPLSATSH